MYIYHPPEVRRREYWGLGVFLLQYCPLVNIRKYCIIIAFTWILLGNKNKKHLRGSYSGHNTPLGHYYNDHGPMGLGQYNSLEYNSLEYCGPHTVSSVFLKLICSSGTLENRVYILFLMRQYVLQIYKSQR